MGTLEKLARELDRWFGTVVMEKKADTIAEADAILAIMDPELRDAYMDGWKDRPLLPTEKDAEAHSLMIWPNKEV